MSKRNNNITELFLLPARNAVELVDGAKGEFKCPACASVVKVWYESFNESSGTIFYQCEGCKELGHVTVRNLDKNT